MVPVLVVLRFRGLLWSAYYLLYSPASFRISYGWLAFNLLFKAYKMSLSRYRNLSKRSILIFRGYSSSSRSSRLIINGLPAIIT
jgi:hypothetical protein